MEKWLRVLSAGVVIALMAGCNLPARINADPGTGALTLAAQTVEAQMTLNALTLPAPQNTNSGGGSPTITLAPTTTPQPTATTKADPCDAAGFIRDVTIPDGTEMQPGETFTKTWRILNEGSCDWNTAYDLVFDEGAAMGGPASTPVTKGTVPAGSQVDISIELVAPETPGVYRGVWQLRNDQDVIFTTGGFWAEIEVVEPEVFSSKVSFQIEQTFEADLDDGSSPAGGIEDFWFRVVSANDKRIEPENTAVFALMGDDKPAYGTCEGADLTSDPIQIDSDLVGQWVCFKTSEGRVGRFQVVSLKPNDISQVQTLELSYITWKLP